MLRLQTQGMHRVVGAGDRVPGGAGSCVLACLGDRPPQHHVRECAAGGLQLGVADREAERVRDELSRRVRGLVSRRQLRHPNSVLELVCGVFAVSHNNLRGFGSFFAFLVDHWTAPRSNAQSARRCAGIQSEVVVG